ncbi:unnamed protein product [Strongylus vulgaris]|uniref:Uncharacterized protein n=1 Tax=Strongylus vulgaris TaxID=40348 RepID=A0A3P7IQ85_STRVU|nr:unnamed protein product [Strongylus vulgaris]
MFYLCIFQRFSCSIRVVESIPDNITFPNSSLPLSTFSAWNRLIDSAQREIYIAAYKSSLQGKHTKATTLTELFYKTAVCDFVTCKC